MRDAWIVQLILDFVLVWGLELSCVRDTTAIMNDTEKTS